MIDAVEVDVEKKAVKCDGWSADLGCDGVCRHPDWAYQWGGRKLCARCAERLKDAEKNWAWLTR